MSQMTQKSFRASQIIAFMNYTVGNYDFDLEALVVIPDALKHKYVEGENVKKWLTWFLDARSRIPSLKTALRQRMNKPELIEYFINHSRSARSKLVKANPKMFFVLPSDLRNLNLQYYRELGAFKPVDWYSFTLGETITYPVFGMLEVLETYNEVILNEKVPEPGSLVLGNQAMNRAFDAVLSPNSR